MNREIYLCKEGSCGWIDLSFLRTHEETKSCGICCKECRNIMECPSLCDVIKFKHLKTENCEFRVKYSDELHKILDKRTKDIVKSKKEIMEIKNRLSLLEGTVPVNSPLDCKVCGNEKVDYDTKVVLLSCPPKYKGFCECGNVQFIETNVYKELIKK